MSPTDDVSTATAIMQSTSDPVTSSQSLEKILATLASLSKPQTKTTINTSTTIKVTPLISAPSAISQSPGENLATLAGFSKIHSITTSNLAMEGVTFQPTHTTLKTHSTHSPVVTVDPSEVLKIWATQELISDILNLDRLIQGVEIYKDHCLDANIAYQYVNHIIGKIFSEARHDHDTFRQLFQEMRQPLQYWHSRRKSERWCSYVRNNIIVGLKAPTYDVIETPMEEIKVSPTSASMEDEQMSEAPRVTTEDTPTHNTADKMDEDTIAKFELSVEMEVTTDGSNNKDTSHFVHNNNGEHPNTAQTPLSSAELTLTGSQTPLSSRIKPFSAPAIVPNPDQDHQDTSKIDSVTLQTSAGVTKNTRDATDGDSDTPMAGGMLGSRWATEAPDEVNSEATKSKPKQMVIPLATRKTSLQGSDAAPRIYTTPAVVEKSLEIVLKTPLKQDIVEFETPQVIVPATPGPASAPKVQIQEPVAAQAISEPAHATKHEAEEAENAQADVLLALQARIADMEAQQKRDKEEAAQREHNLEAENRKLGNMVTSLSTKIKELEVEKQSQRSSDRTELRTGVEKEPKATKELPEPNLKIVKNAKRVRFDLPLKDSMKSDSKAMESRGKCHLYDNRKRKALAKFIPAKTRNVFIRPLRNGELRSRISSKSTDAVRLCARFAKQITHILRIGNVVTTDLAEHARMLSSLLVFHAMYTRANGHIGRFHASSISNDLVAELQNVLFVEHNWMSEDNVCNFHRDILVLWDARISEDDINEAFLNTDRISHEYELELVKCRTEVLCCMQSLEDAREWRKKGYQAEVDLAQREYDECAERAQDALNAELMRFKEGMKSICALVEALGADSLASSQGRRWIECEQLRFESGLIEIGKALKMEVGIVGKTWSKHD